MNSYFAGGGGGKGVKILNSLDVGSNMLHIPNGDWRYKYTPQVKSTKKGSKFCQTMLLNIVSIQADWQIHNATL